MDGNSVAERRDVNLTVDVPFECSMDDRKVIGLDNLYDYVTSSFSRASKVFGLDNLYDYVTSSFSRASKVIGLDEESVKQIVNVVACIVAVCMDPFFLYVPFLGDTEKCLGRNRVLWNVAVALRTVADFFTALILFNISNKSILLMCVKFLALAPIPQILFSEEFILKTLRGYTFWNLGLFCQYGIRLVLIFLSCERLKKRVSARTLARFNAPVYVFLYLTVSHVIGASWYYLSIKRQLSCWNYACKINTGCIFHCDGTTASTLNSTLYNQFCPINPRNPTVFDYGIYHDALQSRIVELEGVLKKFLRCFSWGLRHLSSVASNLETSTNNGETVFVIIIAFVAVLLIYILANVQRFSSSVRVERIKDKMKPIKKRIKLLGEKHNLGIRREESIAKHVQKALEIGTNKHGIYESFNLEWLGIGDGANNESLEKDLRILEASILDPEGTAEKWLSDNNIPHPLRNNILFYMNCKLLDNQDVNLEIVLSVLPDETKLMTKKVLCFDTLKKVPGLENIDEEWFHSTSSKLTPVIYPEGREIIRSGDRLHFIIFITNGIAYSTNAGRRIASLENGHFIGEVRNRPRISPANVVSDTQVEAFVSPATVVSDTQVEAFVLMIDDINLPDEVNRFTD